VKHRRQTRAGRPQAVVVLAGPRHPVDRRVSHALIESLGTEVVVEDRVLSRVEPRRSIVERFRGSGLAWSVRERSHAREHRGVGRSGRIASSVTASASAMLGGADMTARLLLDDGVRQNVDPGDGLDEVVAELVARSEGCRRQVAEPRGLPVLPDENLQRQVERREGRGFH
jgi:hypothetical protein